ncbi:EutP/PduV family microcompartment system protein [Romboutsia maritimum]|uniref:EutP/PduV family microcompartment system protein n=1 Tax=Romboutsia maritimum TaxID=2020948 RepID=A0A371ISR2_9FIRM|nr:EutP/PduV family microcompartment system protein [Romboutsia maritimum]RDY23503.1 EutP/PduV family microcompartment system protein [Romboutsia maritimum]
MKKVIFMGKTGSGKTTLCQKIDELELKYKKTQSVELYNNSIDTPGEYMENRKLYSALMVTSADADIIALVYDPTQGENYIAPGFAGMFCKTVIGIITKINKIKNKEEIELAVEKLTMAGVSEIFKVDTIDGLGVTELLDYLN